MPQGQHVQVELVLQQLSVDAHLEPSQVIDGGDLEHLAGCSIRHKVLLGHSHSSANETVIVAEPRQLPIVSDAIDAVILPHTLDFSPDPHQVLREVERELAGDRELGEGYLAELKSAETQFETLRLRQVEVEKARQEAALALDKVQGQLVKWERDLAVAMASLMGLPLLERKAYPDPGDADNGVSLDAAIRQVRQRFGDVTILKAETKGKNGRRVHRIKFLTDGGRVRTVRIDAQTGEFR